MMTDGKQAEPRRGYRVEVEVHAPPDDVWRAMRDRDALERWFGWDYPELGSEIDFIFFTHASGDDDARVLSLDNGTTVSLEARGPAVTVVRIVQAGPIGEADWEDIYDGEREGWRQFYVQLRHYLERRPGVDRRSLRLGGHGVAAETLSAVEGWLPGTRFDEASPFQRTVARDDGPVALWNLEARRPFREATRTELHWMLTTL